MDFEPVIGLEVHVQLSTKTKIFCGSSAAFGAEPNEFIDPLTLGMPGALPVLNRAVVESAIMLGSAMNCSIRQSNRFARKHYFYPDLPKGYQISQYEEPICEHGHLEVQFESGTRSIGIIRIHMEEDAGKNMHDTYSGTSLVDLNRAGVPLLEVVSQPDIRSPSEAAAYLRTLRQLVRYLGISDGNMEEGSLRCDANISLRPVGELKFGTRAEIKNINSFKFVERALEYEIARQMQVLKSGGTVVQETRLFDSASGVTRSMRSKEESADYRYFPDPDLPPLEIHERWIAEVCSRMPKLPQARVKELVENFGLSVYDASVLTSEKSYADYFAEVLAACQNPKSACNWVTSELFGALNKSSIPFEKNPVSAANLGQLIKLIDAGTISGKMAKQVFEEMFASGATPERIVEQKGLKQITSDDAIIALVRQAFDANPSQFQSYLGGKDQLQAFFVGQVMKLSKGSANPKLVNDCIVNEITARRKSQ